jgi:hypothetical protein
MVVFRSRAVTFPQPASRSVDHAAIAVNNAIRTMLSSETIRICSSAPFHEADMTHHY